MKQIIIITLSLIFFSCKSQDLSQNMSNEQEEVLKVFLNQQDLYSYVDKHFFNKNHIKRFIGDYKNNRRHYRNSDSICQTSIDTLKLKFYCPLADALKKFDILLTDSDMEFLLNKYDYEKEKFVMNLKNVILGTTLLRHTDDYYNRIEYDKYGGIPSLIEFPSIHIENLYFDSAKTTAIIAYSKVTGRYNQTKTLFYILQKKNGVWWKPIGHLQF